MNINLWNILIIIIPQGILFFLWYKCVIREVIITKENGKVISVKKRIKFKWRKK